MVTIVVAIIASVTIIAVTALLCFKGITFYKKMEIIPSKTIPAHTRSPEMDDIEKKLNEVNMLNAQHQAANDNEHVPHDVHQKGYIAGNTAMDAALKKIQDVFGPEISGEGDK